MSLDFAKFQIGKNGLTDGVVQALDLSYKTHKRLKISVLKASGRDRESIVTLAEELCNKLKALSPADYQYKIIGFTIILSKNKIYKTSKKSKK